MYNLLHQKHYHKQVLIFEEKRRGKTNNIKIKISRSQRLFVSLLHMEPEVRIGPDVIDMHRFPNSQTLVNRLA